MMKFGFVSIKNIKKGSELSYDYGYEFDKDDYKDHTVNVVQKMHWIYNIIK